MDLTYIFIEDVEGYRGILRLWRSLSNSFREFYISDPIKLADLSAFRGDRKNGKLFAFRKWYKTPYATFSTKF